MLYILYDTLFHQTVWGIEGMIVNIESMSTLVLIIVSVEDSRKEDAKPTVTSLLSDLKGVVVERDEDIQVFV